MAEPTVQISGRGTQRIQTGHLWVYRSDVIDIAGAGGGDVVCVTTRKGRYLGRAFYSSHSQIALRLLTRDDVPVDRGFWQGRISEANALRQRLFPRETTYRILFSDSDLASSIIVDRYDDYLCLQTLSQGSERIKDTLTDILVDYFQPRAVVVRNDSKVRLLEGLALDKHLAYGSMNGEVCVSINGYTFEVDLLEGQKTGLFLDQRENYAVAAKYAAGAVLDAFSFSGGFAVHCATAACSVQAVDVSESAIKSIERNRDLNRLQNIEAIQGNCFDLLREYAGAGRRYNMVVLDPPAFAKNRVALERAIKGYKEINLRALKLLEPGGVLMTCSCSYHMTPTRFERLLQASAADAHREIQVLEVRGQSTDHPVLLSMPETRYLKCWVLRAV